MRRFAFIATLVLAVSVAFYFWRSNERSEGPSNSSVPGKEQGKSTSSSRDGSQSSTASAPASGVGQGTAVPGPSRATATWNEADFPIAAPLNSAASTIAQDLGVVRELLDAWRSNFPREGNPVGENEQITAALMGDNPLKLVLIPQGHRAVNERGELCDRWGTPFRFHQISGSQMEIRSAGPDRKFATDDDALWAPP